MFWISLLVLMLLVAATPMISLIVEQRRRPVGPEAGEGFHETSHETP